MSAGEDSSEEESNNQENYGESLTNDDEGSDLAGFIDDTPYVVDDEVERHRLDSRLQLAEVEEMFRIYLLYLLESYKDRSVRDSVQEQLQLAARSFNQYEIPKDWLFFCKAVQKFETSLTHAR